MSEDNKAPRLTVDIPFTEFMERLLRVKKEEIQGTKAPKDGDDRKLQSDEKRTRRES